MNTQTQHAEVVVALYRPDDGDDLVTLCQQFEAEEESHPVTGATRWAFADGSCIVAESPEWYGVGFPDCWCLREAGHSAECFVDTHLTTEAQAELADAAVACGDGATLWLLAVTHRGLSDVLDAVVDDTTEAAADAVPSWWLSDAQAAGVARLDSEAAMLHLAQSLAAEPEA